ncbi:diacylglycerol kinase family protein [Streptomyces sp. 135]|uniref:diacylglycerol/lipid kinase family protein n=1 Tax=Streptomyces sp. 135 TaxID=2838850 RepID=UPI001CBF7420|nr:diacylglycerol kinase family protein [Streptomyces sp. 135]
MVPTRSQLPPPARPRVDAPALPEGEGLVVVVNPSSGAQPQLADPVRQLKAALPRAEVVLYEEEAGALPKVLEEAARDVARRGGVLGVCGGDGTVNAAVAPALRFKVPLMVLPGGTFNHFAADLGVDTVADACAAVAEGSAVRADVGRIKPLAGIGPAGRTHTEPSYFLNTFSLGSYPDLVRSREHWSPKIGGPPATLLGVLQILRTGRPLRAVVNGRLRSIWLLFASTSQAPIAHPALVVQQVEHRLVGPRVVRSRGRRAVARPGDTRRSSPASSTSAHRRRRRACRAA